MKIMAADAIKKREMTKEEYENPSLELVSLKLGKGIQEIIRKDGDVGDKKDSTHEETDSVSDSDSTSQQPSSSEKSSNNAANLSD
jgi:hypothetical protein